MKPSPTPMIVLFILLALAAGMFLPVQAGINNFLRGHLGHPALTSFVAFSVGAVFLLLYSIVLGARIPSLAALREIPWWMWLGGGFCGGTFLFLVVVSSARLGAAVLFALVVAGEMLMSIWLDHAGWLGFPSHPINAGRIVGVCLLLAGVVVIHRF